MKSNLFRLRVWGFDPKPCQMFDPEPCQMYDVNTLHKADVGTSVASSPYRYTTLGLGLVFMIQSLEIEEGVQVFGTRDEEGQDEVCKPDAKEQDKAMQVSGVGFRV